MKRIYSSICAAGILSLVTNCIGQQNPMALPQPGRPGFPGGFGGSRPIDPLTGLPTGPQPVRMNIDFSGGSPERLLDLMKEASNKVDQRGAKPNVIIHPETIHTQIPPFSLRDVTANQVFDALNM